MFLEAHGVPLPPAICYENQRVEIEVKLVLCAASALNFTMTPCYASQKPSASEAAYVWLNKEYVISRSRCITLGSGGARPELVSLALEWRLPGFYYGHFVHGARDDHLETVKLMLKHRERLGLGASEAATAIRLATENGHPRIARLVERTIMKPLTARLPGRFPRQMPAAPKDQGDLAAPKNQGDLAAPKDQGDHLPAPARCARCEVQ